VIYHELDGESLKALCGKHARLDAIHIATYPAQVNCETCRRLAHARDQAHAAAVAAQPRECPKA